MGGKTSPNHRHRAARFLLRCRPALNWMSIGGLVAQMSGGFLNRVGFGLLGHFMTC
jgi:hypothetical protein